jgi:catalase
VPEVDTAWAFSRSPLEITPMEATNGNSSRMHERRMALIVAQVAATRARLHGVALAHGRADAACIAEWFTHDLANTSRFLTHSRTNSMAKSNRPSKSASTRPPRQAVVEIDRNSRATVSGPAEPAPVKNSADDLTAKAAGTQELTSQLPFNVTKPLEYDPGAAVHPVAGMSARPDDPIVGSSTVQEKQGSDKTGSGSPVIGTNKTIGPLDRVRADSTGKVLTTNQGVPVGDNQSSLKAGLRGPTLLEDFILREKITHFDHERIPERIVHARGSAAHGIFECYKPLGDLTRADLFSEAGKQTPVFVRFSTVLGERGSTDTARDVRGFAVKFYTQEGNWDLVGNNMPVFFIQDAMKFPDLVHAAKPEPHFAMPQAGTAHDTFWDFASLMPEITHMLMWAMSDRAIPRSYRTMQGFGVHTFRLVNASGESSFVKFHWTPLAGTHSLVWDEAVKISGADPDFHRRDLWEAIEAGVYPEWELGFQVFSEEQAERFTFDILDATKLVPEELVPIMPVGRMVLNRNPDNFFAETEQVAFCTAHVVPGVDFSNDPLLAGRIHSYVDTQISRLGGPNFHEIPINAPVAQVHNNQRDGMHRQAIHRGRVSYEPNSLGGGCPFQAGSAGFVSFAEKLAPDTHKVRGKAERFADHYTQARLFFRSQTPTEQQHIVNAFRFELSRVQTPAIRERMVSGLMNVDADMARAIATGLGMRQMPEPMPKVLETDVTPEVTESPSLSLTARPGNGSIAGRRVAVLVADGVEGKTARSIVDRLTADGAVARFVGARLGSVQATDGDIEVDTTVEAMPSVLFDAVVIPDGQSAAGVLEADGRTLEFVKDQYRHCKPILALGAGTDVLKKAGIPAALPSGQPDPGLILGDPGKAGAAVEAFAKALGMHRHFARETDPPRV